MEHLIDSFDKIINLIHCENINLVILGDLNVDMFKQNKLSDCLEVNGLANIIKEATCNKGKPSLIDLIISNKPRRLMNALSVDTGLSDFHNLICAASRFDIPKQNFPQI